jgi:uncharacterized protein YndB with AHSA1/START domain
MNPATNDRAAPIEDIVKEIAINAPADRVFQAIADPTHRLKWWGAPGRFQLTHMESDLRPGGAYLMTGSGMGDKPFSIRGQYRIVDPPRVLEFSWTADWHAAAAPTIVRFDLDEKSGVTTVRLTHSGFTDERIKENYQGWPWLMALLQKHVQSEEPISKP